MSRRRASGRSPRFLVARSALCLVIAAALIGPVVYNTIIYSPWHDGFVAESSVFSFAKSRYFTDLLWDKSVFNAGLYSVFPASYFIWYSLWEALRSVFVDITAYFVLLALGYVVAAYFFVRLLLSLVHSDIAAASFTQLSIAGALALLYFSSLSNFNYLKSNVFFLLPYLVLPPLLYFALKFVRSGATRTLMPYFLLSLILSDMNMAHAFILIAFLNVFLLLQLIGGSEKLRDLAQRIAVLDILLAPSILLLALTVVGNVWYPGPLSSFAALAAENMYSINANYLNIFLQLTDWGLFGIWNGARYYDFSQFYENTRIWALGLIPYLLLGFALVVTKAQRRERFLGVSLVALGLFVFQFMLGNNNPLYESVYSHVVIFQVFRNVTKLAPLLYFLVLVATYVFLHRQLQRKAIYWTALLAITASLAYNIPYWSYAGYFFNNRAVEAIPSYWYAASSYIDRHAGPGSKILALPAIFVNDVYFWNGKSNWVQGSLLDALSTTRSYRLSECCLGSPEFQVDARALFVPDSYSVRKENISYSMLQRFVTKYHFDYVIVSTDLISEYQNLSDIKNWLGRSGYRQVAIFGKVAIYHEPSRVAAEFLGSKLSFQKLTNLSYRVYLTGIKGTRKFTLEQPYHPAWDLYVEPHPNKAWCLQPTEANGVARCRKAALSTGFDEVRHLSRYSDFPWTHVETADDANEWTLDSTFIRKHFPKYFYKLHPDGSIDVELGIYFRPQAYSLGMFFTAAICFLGFFIYLLISQVVGVRIIWRNVVIVVLVVAAMSALGYDRYRDAANTVGALRPYTPMDDIHTVTRTIRVIGASIKWAAMSRTIYFPAVCNAGKAPAHCTSIRFYNGDVAGTSARWGWDYDVKSSVLTPCYAYQQGSGTCATNAKGTAIDGITSFAAAQTPDGVLLSVASGRSKGIETLTPGRAAFRAALLRVASEPVLDIGVDTGTSEIAFYSTRQASKQLPFSLQHYAYYAAQAPTAWGATGCDGVTRVLLHRPTSPTSKIHVTVAPVHEGICSFRVAADPTQRPAIAEPATVNVDVMGPLSWSPDTYLDYSTILFYSTVAQPQTLTVNKSFDNQPISVVADSGCAQILSLNQVSSSVPALLTSAPSSAPVSVSPLGPGICTGHAKDQYASLGDRPVTIKAQVMGDLSLSATSVISSRSVTLPSVPMAPKSITLYKTYDAYAIEPIISYNGCASLVGFYPQRPSVPVAPQRAPSSTRVLLQPAGPGLYGTCTTIFLDQYGSNERPVSVTITVLPPRGHSP